MNTHILVYINNPTEESAREIAHYLLEKRFIACANIHAVDSMHVLDEDIISDQEYVLVAKTTDDLYNFIVKEVVKIHPYDTPAIIKVPVHVNKAYAEYIDNTVIEL